LLNIPNSGVVNPMLCGIFGERIFLEGVSSDVTIQV
jgi:hypothetical protein